VPKIFAAGIVSTNLSERDAVFSPDGNEFYFTLWSGKFGTIVFVKQENGQWLPPRVAPFSGKYSDLEPFVAADGRRLCFASNRPLEAGGEAKDYDIWFVEREGERWGAPKNIGAPGNGNDDIYWVKSGILLQFKKGLK